MKLIYANLKSSLDFKQTKEYFETLNKLVKNNSIENNYTVFPNNLYLQYLNTEYKDLNIGSQYYGSHNLGSFTTSFSFEQLKELNINNVLIGHFEETKLLKLTNEELNQKIKHSIENDFSPVVCFGEIKDFDNINNSFEFLKKELKELLKNINFKEALILAYEPKWMIGSDKKINIDDVKNLISKLKEFISKEFNTTSKIIYGGNVTKENIYNILNNDVIDGVLIGRSSLNIINYFDFVKTKFK